MQQMAVILRMKWSMIFKDKDLKASEREVGYAVQW